MNQNDDVFSQQNNDKVVTDPRSVFARIFRSCALSVGADRPSIWNELLTRYIKKNAAVANPNDDPRVSSGNRSILNRELRNETFTIPVFCKGMQVLGYTKLRFMVVAESSDGSRRTVATEHLFLEEGSTSTTEYSLGPFISSTPTDEERDRMNAHLQEIMESNTFVNPVTFFKEVQNEIRQEDEENDA